MYTHPVFSCTAGRTVQEIFILSLTPGQDCRVYWKETRRRCRGGQTMTKERLWEIIRFLLVGGGCFLLDYGLLFGLTEYGGFNYLTSSAVSFTVSLVVNYILCVTVVFHAERKSLRQTVLFVATSLAGLAINQVCMYLFVEVAGLWYMLAKIGAAAVVTVWNYITKRLVLRGGH